MKISKELSNGFSIFAGIALFFLLMEFLGLTKVFYLRFLNVFIVFYGVNQTIKSNMSEGKSGFVSNMISAGGTAILGVVFSIAGLLLYIYLRGGQEYVDTLSKGFIFSSNLGINEYCIGLLFEGIASSVIVVFLSMLYWNKKTLADG